MKHLFIIIVIALLPLSPIFAQDEDDDGGEVIMLEEIIIQVAPELPTLVVSIPRQVPEVKPITIQSPTDRMAKSNIESIKPKLGEMNVSKIEQPKKMLAKSR